MTDNGIIQTTRTKKGSAVWLTPEQMKQVKVEEELKIPRFSIIIPTSNQYEAVCNSFNSVYQQLSKHDNIIIADQGSTDGTQPDTFAADPRVFFVSYPKAKKMDIINFAILNVVQTRYVMLLDPRSILKKGALEGLRSSLSTNKPVSTLIMCKNQVTQSGLIGQIVDYPSTSGVATSSKVLPSVYSYTGYVFQKVDAIQAGLFANTNDLYAPGLFMDKMKRLGCSISYRDEFVVNTTYPDISKVKWTEDNQKRLDELLDENITGGYKINVQPFSIIIMDKQAADANRLLSQVKIPNDEIKTLIATPETLVKRFSDEVKKAKYDRIMVIQGSNPVPTYDPITNLRLSFNKNLILTSGVERGIKCTAFSKHLYYKPSLRMAQPTADKIISEVAKRNKRAVELTDLIIHPSKIQTQTVVKNGNTIEVPVRNIQAERRKKKTRSTIYVPKGRKKVQKKKPVPTPRHETVGIPQYSMKWNSVDKLPPISGIKDRAPKILFICDVEGWAWHYKSKQLKRYLSDEFQIDIIWLIGPGARMIQPKKYDLYFTFGYSYIDYLKNVSPRKKITGITAHRPFSVLQPQMQKAAVVHANSMLLFRELRQMHKIVYYVPNGVDEELFYPYQPIPEERNNIVVGHVGKLSVMKGQEQYIKPAIERAAAVPLFHFNDYTNAVPIENMPNVYQDMDVFIVASTEDGTPNPALEAAACGRPIISNRIGNMPEFIKNGYNGFLVEKNINAYVEKINFLRENRHKLIEMGENARKTVEEEWTWKIQAERYRKMFKEVLGIS